MATDGATLTPMSKVRAAIPAGGDTDTDDGSSDSSPDSSDGVVSDVPALSPSLPWYRRGGLHVLEPSHGLILAAVYITLMRELLGPSWGSLHSAYAVVVICCLLYGRLPRGTVSNARWFFCCVVMPIYFSSVPLVFALPAPALSLLAALVLLILKVGVCMSVCLHRYAAHGAFKCGPVTSLAIQWIGCLANQGGSVWWAANHRCHHKFCDVDGSVRDPHSPQLDGAANAFAFLSEHTTVKEEFTPRHCDGVAARVLDTFSALPCVVELCAMRALFGTAGLWASFTSGYLSQLLTLWFNVVNHATAEEEAAPGAAPGATREPPRAKACRATDVRSALSPNLFFECLNRLLWVGVLCGEGTHAHHHAYGSLAHRPGVDLPFHIFVRPLLALGLVWDPKLAGRDKVSKVH